MKLTLQTRLVPDPSQAKALRETVERFNEAANWVAGELFVRGVTNKRVAQKLVYREIRDRFALTAQTAILVIHRVCEAYKRDKAIRPEFRKDAAITYDDRVLRFVGLDKVNLWTLVGRLTIPLLVGAYQAERMGCPKGQCDLVRREDGKWFLLVTVDVPDGTPIPAIDFIGVDLGVANVATDSDGNAYSGKPVEDVRRKHQNHVISKAIVETAKGTGRGVAVEDLSGIRDRLPAWGRETKNRLSGWSFAQLIAFLSYKSQLAGVPIVKVDPRNTSRTCNECGHCSKDNRTSQAKFLCVSCGHAANADQNAALNIRALGLSKRPTGLVDITV